MSEQSSRKAVLVVAVTLALCLGAVTLSFALHRFTPRFVQVTNQASGEVGRTRARGPSLMAFEASGDVLGNGNSTWQVFLFNLLLRDFAGQGGITQITHGPFNARNPAITRPFISGAALVAFEADGTLCADTTNPCDELASPTAGRQIFIYDSGNTRIHQVTRGLGDSRNPSIGGNGFWIAFESPVDHLGTGLVGATTELYLGDLRRLGPSCPQLPCAAPDRGLQRLTTGGGWGAALNYNGKAIAFESTADLPGTNPNPHPGVQQIYVWRDTVITQVTSAAHDSRGPSLNASGKVIAYEQDVVVGANPPTPQVFVTRLKKRGPAVTQVTTAAAGAFGPSINENGWRVAFVSSANLLDNPTQSTGNQIFSQNLRNGILTQVTNAPRGSDSVTSTSQVIVAFASADDFKGNNNTARQLWVANFFKNAPEDFVRAPETPTPVRTHTPFPTPTATLALPTVTATGPADTPTPIETSTSGAGTPTDTPVPTDTPTDTPTPTPTPGGPCFGGLPFPVCDGSCPGGFTCTTGLLCTCQ